MSRFKIVLLISALIGWAASSGYGQQIFKFYPETYIGVKGGANFSGIKFNPTTDPITGIQPIYINKVGKSYGLVIRHISERHFGIMGEVNISEQGWEEEPRDSILYSRGLTYLNIPIMTHVNFGNGVTRFILNIGPSASFLLDDSETITYQRSFNDIEKDTLSLPYYGEKVDSSFDFMFVGGAGVEFNTSIGAFLLEGRYSVSLLSILDDEKYSYSASFNQNIGVSLSWLFLVNKRDKRNPRKFPKVLDDIRGF